MAILSNQSRGAQSPMVVQMNQLQVTKQTPPPQRTDAFFELPPQDMVKKASEIANVLSDVIEKQKLFTLFNGKKHINVEGWQTLGTILGILPKEKRVVEHEDKAFEAEIELVSVRTGLVVGGASSYCGMDEPNWARKPKFSRRSMAITRATGKAYKGAFGWIATLAGYASTPAEEMDGIAVATTSEKDRSNIYTGTSEQNDQIKQWISDFKINHDDIPKLKEAIVGKTMLQIESLTQKFGEF